MSELLRSTLLVDLIAFTLVFLSSVLGFSRRFNRELSSFINWIGAFVVAVFASPYVASLVAKWLGEGRVVALAVTVGVFIAAFIVLFFITPILSTSVKKLLGEQSDRLLGLVFGAVRGFVILCLLSFVLNFSMNAVGKRGLPTQITDSLSWPIVDRVTRMVMKKTPLRDMGK